MCVLLCSLCGCARVYGSAETWSLDWRPHVIKFSIYLSTCVVGGRVAGPVLRVHDYLGTSC